MVWNSAIDLGAAPANSLEADLKLGLDLDRDVVPDAAPPGEVLATMSDDDGLPMYTFVKDDDGVLMRFHRLCEFRLDQSLSTATCRLGPGVDAGYAVVLAKGMLASVVLTLRGHPVLHASACEWDGAGTALVGASGMGKSTLLALLCSVGARHLSDDVLRVDFEAGRAVCRRGTPETRLRDKAAYLANDGAAKLTADGRHAVVHQQVGADRTPLRCIVVPYPNRDVDDVAVQWLSPRDALRELMRFPRIVGWQEPVTTAAYFSHAARLAVRIPVGRLVVPWREALHPDIATRVMAAVLSAPSVARDSFVTGAD